MKVLVAEKLADSGIEALREHFEVDLGYDWSADDLARNLAACAQAGVTLVEQPLPAGHDDALARMRRPLPAEYHRLSADGSPSAFRPLLRCSPSSG